MTPQPKAGDDQAVRDDRAARVWAVMRDLTARYPSPEELRAALALGRGSGRVKAMLRLAAGPLRKLVALTPHGQQATERLIRIQREPPPGFAVLTGEELGLLDHLLSRIAASS